MKMKEKRTEIPTNDKTVIDNLKTGHDKLNDEAISSSSLREAKAN